MRTLRALIIDDEVRRAINAIVVHAADPRHWYDAQDRSDGWIDRLPGNNAQHSIHIIDGYRCVFSYTRGATKKIYRHLSIGVDGGAFPNSVAVYELSKLFGFAGETTQAAQGVFPWGWMLEVKRGDQLDDNCIVVAQDTGIRA